MFENVLVAARDRKRLGEIAAIISRFGLESLAARLGLAARGGSQAPTPARAREALESLGPTFIKLGQILATRADLLPPDWIAELEKLHSSAPVLPFESLRSAVEATLGEPPEAVFAAFDHEPLAAASIAQVHRATLHDGTPVVLKVRRPGIAPQMEADLRLMAAIADTAAAHPAVARYRPREIIAQLGEAMLAELDFAEEGRNAESFARNFRNEQRLIIPRIHWAWSGQDLLVQDFVEGTPPTDAARLRSADIDPRAIAATGADIVLKMVLVDGFFHGDPHPGNMLTQSGGRIALLDFGMVGRVSPRRREELLGFVQSITGRDPARLADLLAAWTEGADRGRLEAAAARLVARHGEGRLVLAAVVEDLMQLLREEALVLPPDLILIFKALVTLDGVLGRIDPEFDLSQAARNAWLSAMQARYEPEAVRTRLSSLLLELAQVEDNLPRLIRSAAARLADPPPPPPQPRGDWRVPAAIIAGAALIALTIALQ